MKYMLLIYADENAWTDSERQHCYVESTELTHELNARGQYIAASPLQPVATATSVRVREGKRLVTDGPYRFLRHPRYLGILVSFAGISLVFRSWLALILVGVIKAVLLWRIYDEEALMRDEFGAAWERYCRCSWRLLPFVF